MTYVLLHLANHDISILVALHYVNELPYQGQSPGDGGDLWLLFGGFWGHIRLYKIKTSI